MSGSDGIITSDGEGGSLIRVKASPGASRDAIAGTRGDRLKVRVGAPPEGGRANDAICALLAGALGARPRDAEVTHGRTSPEKTIRVRGVPPDDARRALLDG